MGVGKKHVRLEEIGHWYIRGEVVLGVYEHKLCFRARGDSVVDFAEGDAFKALRQGEIDLALGRFGAARPGYVTEKLYEDRYCVAARKGHPKVRGRIDEASWREIGHVFAWSRSETAIEESGKGSDVVPLAYVPQWLTVLLLVAATDGLATCPRRLAERHAEMLGLQVLDPPFEPDVITVSILRRAGVEDAGVEWFLGQVRAAVDE